MNLKSMIREVPDFPTKGINFKDITTLLKDHDALRYTSSIIVEEFRDKNITKVLGIESRGFILGGLLACELNAGFVPVRKKENCLQRKFLNHISLNTESTQLRYIVMLYLQMMLCLYTTIYLQPEEQQMQF
jgi:adenine phosphoribosyltransferase